MGCVPRSVARAESCEASGVRPTALAAAGQGLTTVVMFLLVPQVKPYHPAETPT
jgi:hypothetical protein